METKGKFDIAGFILAMILTSLFSLWFLWLIYSSIEGVKNVQSAKFPMYSMVETKIGIRGQIIKIYGDKSYDVRYLKKDGTTDIINLKEKEIE